MKFEKKYLADICDIKIGRTPPRSESHWFSKYEGIEWISIKDMGQCEKMINSTSEKIIEEAVEKFRIPLIPENTVILSFKLTVGRVAITSKEMISNEAIAQLNIKNNKNVDTNYLYYYLKNYDFNMLGSTSSIATAINSKMLRDIPILLPDIKEQRQISEVLSCIDKKIELNSNTNNNLYKLIKNNYESLIVSGDWEEIELGTISNITSGKRPLNKLENGKYPVIGANGIMAYTSDYNFSEDLIITGRVGTLGVVKRYSDYIWASDNTLVIQTKYLNYVENYLKTIDYYSLNRGSTQPLLTQGDLKKQIVPFNEDLVTKFEKDNQIFVDKIRNNDKESKKLEQLRDTLLPKLMNGEIDLDNIEI